VVIKKPDKDKDMSKKKKKKKAYNLLQRCLEEDASLMEGVGCWKLVKKDGGYATEPFVDLKAAQVAYEAYAKHTCWTSAATGYDLPTWDELPESVKNAWVTEITEEIIEYLAYK